MTIYLTKWTEVIETEDQQVNFTHVYAATSMTDAKKKYNELKQQIKTGSDFDLLPVNEAITKHTPKTQAEVVELINSLS